MFARGQLKRLRRDERGGAAIEFAIVAPFFIGLLLGILGLGWAVNAISGVNYATERASRALQLRPSMSQQEIQAAVQQHVGYLEPTTLTVTVAIDAPSGGYRLGHVTATYSQVIELPFIGSYPINYSSIVTVPLIAS